MASMIAAPMRMSRSERRDISSCHVRCSCSVSPRAAEKSWECRRRPTTAPRTGRWSARRSSPARRGDRGRLRSRCARCRCWSAVWVVCGARRRGFELRAGFGLGGFEAPGLVLGLEHHVALERFADLCLEFEDRQLQQADGLLQLRGHRELLAKFELQGWLEHSSRNFGSRSARAAGSAPASPKISSKIYSLKSWPKYTSRTCRFARISSAVPAAITEPLLTM